MANDSCRQLVSVREKALVLNDSISIMEVSDEINNYAV